MEQNKTESTRIKKTVIKAIFFLLCFLIIFPIIMLYKPLRPTADDTILLYSIVSQTVGMIILIMSLILLTQYRKASYIQLLPLYFIIIYLVLSLISSILAEDSHLAFWGDYRGEGYYMYVCYIGIAVGTFLLKRYDEKLIKKIMILLVLVSSVLAIASLIDKFLCFFNITEWNMAITGYWGLLPTASFVNSNYYGYYLAITLILSVNFMMYAKTKLERNLFIFTTVLISIVSSFNHCRGAVTAFAVGYILYILYHVFIKKDKKKVYVLLILIPIRIASDVLANMLHNWLFINKTLSNISSLFIDDELAGMNSFIARRNMYIAAIKLTLEKPLLGYGIDNIRSHILELSNIPKERCHNEILQKFATIGIPGTLAYLSAVGIIFIRFIKSIKQFDYLLAGIFFSGLIYFGSAQFGVSTPMTAPYFFIMMGIIYASTFKSKDEEIKTVPV